MDDLALLLNLGLSRLELTALLLLEAMGLALLGTAVGILLGLGLSVVSWLPARDYLGLEPGFAFAGTVHHRGSDGAAGHAAFRRCYGDQHGLRPRTVMGHQPRKH